MEFRDYLKRKCRERGISLHRLALLCDLNQIYFYQAVNKNKENPPPWVLRRAAPHLGVTYMDLLLAAGYLSDADVREWQESRSLSQEGREEERVGKRATGKLSKATKGRQLIA
ncbi:MAG TPA: hypothetical protein VE219_03615 [Candidatus Sulfotelmatobacter sp.]|nr:hypothetical protein [Candidatus Sulfotelmatobacter sp.]